jgi:type II secretory pathway pseudopilin PulG
MRKTIITLMAGLVLLSIAAAASAQQQSDMDALRATVKQLSDQLKAVTEKLQELEAKQAAPATPAPVVVAVPAPAPPPLPRRTGTTSSRSPATGSHAMRPARARTTSSSCAACT